MNDFVGLQKKVKSYLARRQPSESAKLATTVSKVPSISTVPEACGPDQLDPIAARLSRLVLATRANKKQIDDIDHRNSGPMRDTPNSARPLLPKSITIDAQKLLSYLRDEPSLSILFLDVRPRSEFEVSHIDGEHVVNIDPIVCRPNLNSQDIEDSFAVGPERELSLFEKRHEFDLLVVYDWSSKSLLPAEADSRNHHPQALQNLQSALWERMGWRKPLLRAPVLLIGGMDTWLQLKGPVRASQQGVARDSPSSTLKPLLVQHTETTPIDVSAKKKNRGTSVVQAMGSVYPRSVHEYIFSEASARRQSMAMLPQPTTEQSTADQSINSSAHALQSRTVLSRQGPSQSFVGPYLQNTQLPDKPRRVGAAPVYLRQPSVGSQGSRLGQTSIGKTGLKNLGNSCFMNAVLQCLAACFPLARYFTSGQWRSDVNGQNPLGYQGNVAKEFAKVLRELSSDDNSVIAPTELRNELGKTRPEFANGDQQDAQELLNFILDALHEDLNAHALKPRLRELTEEEEFYRETLDDSFVSETEWKRHTHRNMSIIVKLFQGQLQSRLKCMTCGHTSTTYNAFSSLSLPIPSTRSPVTLEDCVNEFVRAEGMSGDDSWLCPKCKVRRNASKKLSISKLPDVLVVHFKRFESKGPWRDKLNSNISFPLNGLDMTNYLDANLQGPAAMKSVYDIFGIVYHRGSMEGGHYTAMVNPDAARTNDWTLFDDSRVAPNTEIDGRASYLLFYSKRSPMI